MFRNRRRTSWEIQVDEKMEKIMADQDTLNALVARVNAGVASVSAEVTALKAQIAADVPPAALDFSGLDAATAALEGLEPPATS